MMKTANGLKQFCVVYRVGAPSDFKWMRSMPMTRDEAKEVKEDLESKGFNAMFENYERSLAIGLPETFGFMDKVII